MLTLSFANVFKRFPLPCHKYQFFDCLLIISNASMTFIMSYIRRLLIPAHIENTMHMNI